MAENKAKNKVSKSRSDDVVVSTKKQSSSLRLNPKTPVLAIDDVVVSMKKNGSLNLLFLQYVQKGKQAEADVVAAVKLYDEVMWKELKQQIDESYQRWNNKFLNST